MNYQIYQSERPRFVVDTDKKVYNKSDYLMTYEGQLEDNGEDPYERIYFIFNGFHPADFKSYSLSVGDIVVIDGVAKIVDAFGYKDIELQ